MCGDLTLGFNKTAVIHCGHMYLTPMTGLYVQTAIAIQTRTVNKQEDLAPEGGLLSDAPLPDCLTLPPAPSLHPRTATDGLE